MITAQEFLDWVETTQLFNVIKEETQRQGWCGVMPRITTPGGGLQFQLEPGVMIYRATDLPKEVLMEFFINSPFYEQAKWDSLTKQLKLLE